MDTFHAGGLANRNIRPLSGRGSVVLHVPEEKQARRCRSRSPSTLIGVSFSEFKDPQYSKNPKGGIRGGIFYREALGIYNAWQRRLVNNRPWSGKYHLLAWDES
jgi:hypothetical protein